jgi:hypothetical protein
MKQRKSVRGLGDQGEQVKGLADGPLYEQFRTVTFEVSRGQIQVGASAPPGSHWSGDVMIGSQTPVITRRAVYERWRADHESLTRDRSQLREHVAARQRVGAWFP